LRIHPPQSIVCAAHMESTSQSMAWLARRDGSVLIPPFSPPSGPATGSFTGLHAKSNFLATTRLKAASAIGKLTETIEMLRGS